MRLEQIRCDFCEIELFYNNNGKKITDRTYLKVDRIDGLSGNLCDKVYCSVDCLKFATEQIHSVMPTFEDHLKSLAKKTGYEIKKLETK